MRAEAAAVLEAFEDFGLLSTLPAALATLGEVLGLMVNTRWLETAATCFDCCLSQPISDDGNRRFTTKDPAFDVREAFEPVPEVLPPEGLELVAMSFP